MGHRVRSRGVAGSDVRVICVEESEDISWALLLSWRARLCGAV